METQPVCSCAVSVLIGYLQQGVTAMHTKSMIRRKRAQVSAGVPVETQLLCSCAISVLIGPLQQGVTAMRMSSKTRREALDACPLSWLCDRFQ